MLLQGNSQTWAVLNHKKPFGLRNQGFILMWRHWRLLAEAWPYWANLLPWLEKQWKMMWASLTRNTVTVDTEGWLTAIPEPTFPGEREQVLWRRVWCEERYWSLWKGDRNTYTQIYIHTSHTYMCTHKHGHMDIWTHTPHRLKDTYTYHTCLHTCISI